MKVESATEILPPDAPDDKQPRTHTPAPAHAAESTSPKLVIAALGVVFGDIGTSPLYAFQTCFKSNHLPVSPDNVMGLLSLIFWALILVISVKYVMIIMRADNRGEGGVLALSTLLTSASRNWRLWAPVSALGLFGAALFFGDGMITPAVTVLSAIEGLELVAPGFERFVLPCAVAVLSFLFFMQKRGTGAMGRAFGPVMLAWFGTLAVLGISWIVRRPEVLLAVNPIYGVRFFAHNGGMAFVLLSAVFLAVTGGEALYADMGHFGREPIRNAWFMLVLPALVLNYFGQGALLLENADAASNPFYRLVPSWMLVPLVLLATTAAIIASQAVISGVFSVTRQALNLGYLPRLRILHSSEEEIGQVYVPAVNWLLYIGTVLLVLGFRSSTALAGAYGIAVSSTMPIESIMVIMLLLVRGGRGSRRMAAISVTTLIIDLMFFAANLLKLHEGGWLPVTTGIVAYTLMSTWHEGRRTLNWLVARDQPGTREFLADLAANPPHRVPGTAVYLASEASGIPRALAQNLRFNRVMHERNVLLTFVNPETPHVPANERVEVQTIAPGLVRVVARYGFMETPNITATLRLAEEKGVPYQPEETLYVVGRENPVITRSSGMPMWRKRLFAILGRNAQMAAAHFGVPPHRLLEIGTQVRI
jgi:KUP system potassium uptake protein